MELLIFLVLVAFGVRSLFRKLRAAHGWLGEGDNLVDTALPWVSYLLLLGLLARLMLIQ